MTKQKQMYRCILYGAYGDAFGSDLEMMTLNEIRSQYGEQGKQKLNSDDTITDDTQMTLFTLEGLALSQGKSMDERVQIMYESYLRWFNDRTERNSCSHRDYPKKSQAAGYRRRFFFSCIYLFFVLQYSYKKRTYALRRSTGKDALGLVT